MAWSYDPTDLDSSTASGRLNIVRFLVGDTDTTNQLVSDEEINFALLTEGDDVYSAGSLVAKSLSAKYASYVDIELDGQLREDYSQLTTQYANLSSMLSGEGDTKKAKLGVFAGGISKTEMDRVENLPDRVAPYFRRDSYKWPCWDSDKHPWEYY